jgi:RNA polymerase sigma-70 factor (ECF subfamily)
MPSVLPINPGKTSSSLRRVLARPTTIDLLFSRVRKDDYTAFESIFKNNYHALCSYSNRFVLSRQLAEEIVDDVFCTLWKNRKKIRITTSFYAYLATSVRNRSLDSLRKLKQEKRKSVLQHAEAIPCGQSIAYEMMMLNELNERIEAAVRILPRQCRIIFLMSREEDLKYKDIAEKLNISIRTVDTQIGRALKQLRKVIA